MFTCTHTPPLTVLFDVASSETWQVYLTTTVVIEINRACFSSVLHPGRVLHVAYFDCGNTPTCCLYSRTEMIAAAAYLCTLRHVIRRWRHPFNKDDASTAADRLSCFSLSECDSSVLLWAVFSEDVSLGMTLMETLHILLFITWCVWPAGMCASLLAIVKRHCLMFLPD